LRNQFGEKQTVNKRPPALGPTSGARCAHSEGCTPPSRKFFEPYVLEVCSKRGVSPTSPLRQNDWTGFCMVLVTQICKHANVVCNHAHAFFVEHGGAIEH